MEWLKTPKASGAAMKITMANPLVYWTSSNHQSVNLIKVNLHLPVQTEDIKKGMGLLPSLSALLQSISL